MAAPSCHCACALRQPRGAVEPVVAMHVTTDGMHTSRKKRSPGAHPPPRPPAPTRCRVGVAPRWPWHPSPAVLRAFPPAPHPSLTAALVAPSTHGCRHGVSRPVFTARPPTRPWTAAAIVWRQSGPPPADPRMRSDAQRVKTAPQSQRRPPHARRQPPPPPPPRLYFSHAAPPPPSQRKRPPLKPDYWQ